MRGTELLQRQQRRTQLLRQVRGRQSPGLPGDPFHQNMMDSHRFMAGNFDTRFVEERFSMDQAEEDRVDDSQIAAILATLVAHREERQSAQIVQRGARDTSNWKWVGRYERMHR